MRYNLLFVILALLLVLLSICLLFSKQIILPQGLYLEDLRNTDGSLSFTVRTVSYGGSYAPRNTGAIWITNSSNQFVKTIKIWAQNYRSTLVKWLQSSSNNTTGAITGASLTSHQLHTVSWNGTNTSGAQVADGDYKINVEFAEHNATTSNPGKYKYLTFTKGSALVDQTPANEAYFTNMHLTWTPSNPTYGNLTGTVTNNSGSPIEGATVTISSLTATTNATGVYSLSNIPTGTYTVSCSASNYTTHTQSNVLISNNQTTTVNFNMGNPANGILSGTVFNGSNEPIPGATISIGALSTSSDSNGQYSISLQPGTFSVDCSAPNYNNIHESNVAILSNQTTTLNFILSPTSNDDNSSIPRLTNITSNYPNPFNKVTHISYYLDKKSKVSFRIYNLKGQLVKNFSESLIDKGSHEINWDGKDIKGVLVSNGNYIVQLKADNKLYTKVISFAR